MDGLARIGKKTFTIILREESYLFKFENTGVKEKTNQQLLCAFTTRTSGEAMNPTGVPRGCDPSISAIFYQLCDLTAVWGIVLEACAAAGMVTSFMLFVIVLASLPFVTDKKRKGMVALQASILVFTLGLFGLTFAFIVDRYSTSCVARRFLFGVLFSGCLSCLVMHGLWLVLLERRGSGPRSWTLWLGALALWLVEVIINTEWLIITEVRNPLSDPIALHHPCIIANQDFVMALIYVMLLLLAVVLIALPSLKHKHKQWRRDGAFILVTGFFTSAIWVTWIVMYTYGNGAAGHASWDDPTLGIAVVSNAWVFLGFYAIPEVCLLTQEDSEQEQPLDGEHVYPARTLVYGPDLKEPEPTQQNVYVENKAFSMDEAAIEPTTPVSPYAVYNGQRQSSVYQPTEIALIAKHLKEMDQGARIPRATAPPLNPGSGRSSLSRSVESLASQERS